jgi:hypothetical protein
MLDDKRPALRRAFVVLWVSASAHDNEPASAVRRRRREARVQEHDAFNPTE